EMHYLQHDYDGAERAIEGIAADPASDYWLAKSFILWADIFHARGNNLQAKQTLQSIIGGGDLSNEEMVTNAIDAVNLSKLMESESVIETLILSQGFTDCVVYLDDAAAKVVVESDGLTAAQAAAIKEIILTEADIPAEGIRIFEVAAGTAPQ
ncbi:MAG: SpoIIIAH-like family protein, partial [Oscillospiraceae bacterium]|nr:SpoIIIAH-like family protein [Oscillospiraceae bacterium]